MPLATGRGEFYDILSWGPVAQRVVGTSEHGLPATVASSANVTSNLIFSDGFKSIAIGLTSTQAGLVTVQRYLDAGATIAQGNALTVNLSATNPSVLNTSDSVAFQCFTVNISNTGGSTANLSGLIILLQAN
jgi:hypothetical protein